MLNRTQSLVLALSLIFITTPSFAKDNYSQRDADWDRYYEGVMAQAREDAREGERRIRASQPRQIVIIDSRTGEPTFGTIQGY